MTFRNLKAALCGTAVIVLGMGATAAQAATATATAKATILRQITVTKTADLDFGTIVTAATASTVDVSALGVRTCGTGLTCTGTVTAAGFGIVGTTGQTVTIAATSPVTLNSGANTMSAVVASSAASRLLTGTAADAFTVGGTLAVGASQADGVYSGTMTVTVNYQ